MACTTSYANGVRYPRVSLSLIARQPLIKRQSARLPPQVNTGIYTYLRTPIQSSERTLFLYLPRYREFRSVELPSATF